MGLVPGLSGFVSAVSSAWIAYVAIVRLPHLGHAHAVLRAASEAALAWLALCSACHVAGAFGGADFTLALPAAPLVGIAGGIAALVRLQGVCEARRKFFAMRASIPGKTEKVHRFFDGEDAQVKPESTVEGGARPGEARVDGGGNRSRKSHIVSGWRRRRELFSDSHLGSFLASLAFPPTQPLVPPSPPCVAL